MNIIGRLYISNNNMIYPSVKTKMFKHGTEKYKIKQTECHSYHNFSHIFSPLHKTESDRYRHGIKTS
jgi:hypothetical protein